MDLNAIELDITWLNLIVGALIPLLTGLLTKLEASSKVKAWVTLGLAALASAVQVVIDMGGVFELNAFASTFFTTFATSITAYYGFLKPTDTANVVQLKTASFGVGGSSTADAA